MQYNIHPIIVHFPIALLFVYSLLKIVPLRKILPRVAWDDIRFSLLLFGVIGAAAALATGESAEHLTRPNRALVETHAFFATAATWLYGALLAGEIIRIFNHSVQSARLTLVPVKKVTVFLERILCDRFFSGALALIAFGALAISGLLGGVMVYGTSADPFAASMLRLLKLSI